MMRRPNMYTGRSESRITKTMTCLPDLRQLFCLVCLGYSDLFRIFLVLTFSRGEGGGSKNSHDNAPLQVCTGEAKLNVAMDGFGAKFAPKPHQMSLAYTRATPNPPLKKQCKL